MLTGRRWRVGGGEGGLQETTEAGGCTCVEDESRGWE